MSPCMKPKLAPLFPLPAKLMRYGCHPRSREAEALAVSPAQSMHPSLRSSSPPATQAAKPSTPSCNSPSTSLTRTRKPKPRTNPPRRRGLRRASAHHPPNTARPYPNFSSSRDPWPTCTPQSGPPARLTHRRAGRGLTGNETQTRHPRPSRPPAIPPNQGAQTRAQNNRAALGMIRTRRKHQSPTLQTANSAKNPTSVRPIPTYPVRGNSRISTVPPASNTGFPATSPRAAAKSAAATRINPDKCELTAPATPSFRTHSPPPIALPPSNAPCRRNASKYPGQDLAETTDTASSCISSRKSFITPPQKRTGGNVPFPPDPVAI